VNLWGVSDLHVHYAENRAALEALPESPEDWLAVAGDVAETEEQLAGAFAVLARKFGKLFWTPGNHELWTRPRRTGLRGDAKYRRMIEIARAYGVHTPEDPFEEWTGPGRYRIAPLFVLYDYSFRPDGVAHDDAVRWAEAGGAHCADELLLDPEPYESVSAWCRARVRETEARLADASRDGTPLVLVNHYPLRSEDVRLPRMPRFAIWCGTRATADWHERFGARVAVTGHLHARATSYGGDCRFEAVALGYPQDWRAQLGLRPYLRRILPDTGAENAAPPKRGRST
jgi:3',5'-cyclic AMP phosphodiesterase CpdA